MRRSFGGFGLDNRDADVMTTITAINVNKILKMFEFILASIENVRIDLIDLSE